MGVVVTPDWLAVPTALLVDVPGYTRFPLFPLCGFTAVGVVVGAALKRRSPAEYRSFKACATGPRQTGSTVSMAY